MPNPSFYLGRYTDADLSPVMYNPPDLTTHAIIIGMTGSGKTGLLISLLEEAVRQRLPAIVIDPKGDLTNLFLHFPELRPADFEPWLDPEAARRAGVTLPELAVQTAERWKKGLADWNLGPQELEELGSAVDYSIFTPGSTAGSPVSLVSSFAAPDLPWEENREVLRERISSTITALLGLIGMSEIDPLRSREHILLSNLLENAWSQGHSLDLTELILQVQSPPIERLGAFPLERFFPEKDRFDLALLLNNFLASPSFQTWMEGESMDAGRFLYGPDGRPRVSIFYLAHLSETERMFFVTLLLASVESWMRSQRGTGGLRALLAFDEITGYLPPVANPPSRPVLLRLLKQARAFGLGLALATQNPTDLNYKALSNAGSWFIGRLQTERDKERLLDGLMSLEGGIDRAAFDQLTSSLKPRVFLLHNVHGKGPRLFSTRWCMNFLAGPLTRAQIPQLAKLKPQAAPTPTPAAAPARTYESAAPAAAGLTTAGAGSRPAAAPVKTPAITGIDAQLTRPPLPPGTSEIFFAPVLDVPQALAALGGAYPGPLEPLGLLYRPALLAQAEVRFLNRRYNLDTALQAACIVLDPARGDWDSTRYAPITPDPTVRPAAGARYANLPAPWSTRTGLSALQKDFTDWVLRTSVLQIWSNEALKVYAPPSVADSVFRAQLEQAAREAMQPDLEKTTARYDDRLEALKRKIERQHGTIDRREDVVDQRKREQTGADFEFLTSFLGRRKKSVSSSLTKRRMTSQAKNELEEAKQTLKELNQQWNELQKDRQAALQAVVDDWKRRTAQVTRVPVAPLRKDIFIQLFAIGWMPYHLLKARDGLVEAPAYILR